MAYSALNNIGEKASRDVVEEASVDASSTGEAK
jgi:hypothetical protein